MSTLAQLSDRLQRLSTEVEIAKRKQKEDVAKAVKAISEINPDDVEVLSTLVPHLKDVVNFTEEDLLSNTESSFSIISQTKETLRKYLEERLSFYEEQL